MSERLWGVFVKDIKIQANGQGIGWWLQFRQRNEPLGRVIHIPGTATPQGDHAWVRCDGDPESGETSRAHADWLCGFMVEQGVHKTSVAVRRMPRALESQ